MRKVKVYNFEKIIPKITDGKYQPHIYRQAAIITANGKTLMIDYEMIHQFAPDNTLTFGLNDHKLNKKGENILYFIAAYEGSFDVSEIVDNEFTEMYLGDFVRDDYRTHHRISANCRILEDSFAEMGLDLHDYLDC